MNGRHELQRNLRFALRSFRREPTFIAGIVMTFALAIGANAAMFGLVTRLMLAPPPGIRAADRVVSTRLRFTTPAGETFEMSTMSYPSFKAIATLQGAFSAVAAVSSDSMTWGRGADLSEVAVVKGSGEYFNVLGARPALGRLFGPSDDALPDGNSVIVLSHAYWQRRFSGDPHAVGREVILDDQPFTIIGVAEKEFNGADLSPVDLFVPLTAGSRSAGAGWWTNPGMRVVTVLARLRDGVGASAAASLVTAALGSDPETTGNAKASASLESVVPGSAARASAQGRIALWLSGVSLVVLLIATANVGTLLLLRAARRRRDAAVRVALGASHASLVRQSLTESVLLALAGSIVGLVLARWFADIIRTTLLPNLAPTERLVNGGVLLATIAAATGAGLLAGLSPLAQLRGRHLATELRTGGHGSSARFHVQNVLVAIQVALCTVLLVGAGLFVQSLQKVQSQDLGFSTAHLLYVHLDFRGRVPALDRDLVHEEAARRLQSVPGVTAATVVQGMPFSTHHVPPISIPGVPDLMQSGVQLPILYGATPAYLTMMGVKLREGRLLNERDTRGTPLVVLVNESMARSIWPGQSAIGKCIRTGYASPDVDPAAMAAAAPCREVVGVVRDSRARSLRLEGNEGKLMQYYVPFAQLPAPPMPDFAEVHGILVQSAGDPARIAAAVQRTIQGGSAVPVYARVRPYQELIDPQLRSWRLGATLFPIFGALALGIAAVGLFGVISYLVTQRTQEIGVRLALGGSPADVGRGVVADAVRMAAIGAGAGVLAAMVAAPLVQSLLFQTAARDPLSATIAAGVLLGVAIGAAAIPAWRAGQVSPLTALKAET
ncbi:MAG: ADOP family duplicated permease [Gemmatimonadaceae bacterium]